MPDVGGIQGRMSPMKLHKAALFVNRQHAPLGWRRAPGDLSISCSHGARFEMGLECGWPPPTRGAKDARTHAPLRSSPPPPSVCPSLRSILLLSLLA